MSSDGTNDGVDDTRRSEARRGAGRAIVRVLWIAPLALLMAASTAPQFLMVKPASILWRDIPDGLGARYARVAGDDTKPGMYVVRVRFPPHVMDLPHSHPNARYVTVLEGTWYAGTGPAFDPKRATPLPAGSVMVHPAGAVHWDGSAGDEPVTVQIIGEGPGNSIPLQPGRAQWVHVP